MDLAQSSLVGQVSSSSSDLVSHLDHNQAPNGGHISFFERLPQEILNQIVGLLYSSHPSHACRLLRTSRFLRNGVQRRLYELHLKLSNGLLGWACAWGYENMVDCLIEIPYDISRSFRCPKIPYSVLKLKGPIHQSYTTTPLHIAVLWNRVEILLKLMRRGASVHATDTYGLTPLFLSRREEITEALLDAGACTNTTSGLGTVLLRALDPQLTPPRPGNIKLLLEKGHADANDFRHGTTPLIFAINNNVDIQIVDLLLQNGADPDFVPQDSDNSAPALRYFQNHWKTPLMLAVHRPNCLELMKLLLRHGASANASCAATTPLVEAVASASIETVEFLLAAGADINGCGAPLANPLGPSEETPDTPLRSAISRRNLDMMKVLVTAGANVNQQQDGTKDIINLNHNFQRGQRFRQGTEHYRVTPLITAVEEDFADGVEYLLNQGAQWTENDHYVQEIRRYLCHYSDKSGISKSDRDATRIERLRILDILFETGQAVHDPTYESPIFLAVAGQDVSLIRKVIDHGGDIKMQEKLRSAWRPEYTPLHHALLLYIDELDERAPDMVTYLLDCGAESTGHRTRFTPLGSLIINHCGLFNEDTNRDYVLDFWSPIRWDMARRMLEHPRGGAVITAEFSSDMMALFLIQAITALPPKSDGCLEEQDIADRVELFASLTNFNGRWGPDGLSGLRELTLCPRYMRDELGLHDLTLRPRYKRGELDLHGWENERSCLMVMAPTVAAKLCTGRGNPDWRPPNTGLNKYQPMSDDELLPAFQLLFGLDD